MSDHEASGQTRTATGSGAPPEGAGGAGFAAPPRVSLPQGGGAIRGLGEKFEANPATGTGSFTVPIATTPGRSGFGPTLALSYDSGRGNGPFGLGWGIELPSVTRKTEKRLPRYEDGTDADVFLLAGTEDLVPLLDAGAGWARVSLDEPAHAPGFRIDRYRPRTEGLFARIERWTSKQDGEVHWRSISAANVTTLYGTDAESRIADPADPTRVFEWLVARTYDDRGNSILYEYKPEDSDCIDQGLAHEAHRKPTTRSANRYLKRIRYGNRKSALPGSHLNDLDWAFEVLFDYGEHDVEAPTSAEIRPWPRRDDAFSTYRASFEIRTYRLCRRILMVHHFPAEPDVGADCLVRATELEYESDRAVSQLTEVTQRGYRRRGTGYLDRALPTLELDYTERDFHDDLLELDHDSIENLPAGLAGDRTQLVDLDGEGSPGVLVGENAAWFYKPNLGGGRFGPLETLPTIPGPAGGDYGDHQLMDLSGDGQLDVVQLDGPTPGFFERTDDESWGPFSPLSSLPNISWDDPNLRLVDLDGDGLADILIAGDEIRWYRSLGENGFGEAREPRSGWDETDAPRLVFADGTDSLHLADMSGDGLSDLVRIRNGSVAYWPNLGHGRFGSRVTMDDPPAFDLPDTFDPSYLRLADVDGSGATDIVYLGGSQARIWLNQSGNSFSEPHELPSFPSVDNASAVTTADLLGTGMSCLVWSTQLPDEGETRVAYVDPMGGTKPYLLTGIRNNLGVETEVRYASSTSFYLADKAAGRSWLTRLPFPVHVVDRVITRDRVARNRFSTLYAYHHGYYDGREREFRGFGMVEQIDTEEIGAIAGDPAEELANIDAATALPPVLTKTWYHHGADESDDRLARQFAMEYWHEPDAGEGVALLPDTVLPDTVLHEDGTRTAHPLTPEEEREASRALKGSMLRQEVYALDGSEAAGRPFVATERNMGIELLQPRRDNRHAVLFTHPRETVTYQYERALYDVPAPGGGTTRSADPRVAHELTIEVDAFGNVLRSAAVSYPRRHPDPAPELDAATRAVVHAEQGRLAVTSVENAYTNAIDEGPLYRTPELAESRTFELVNVAPETTAPYPTNLFRFDQLAEQLTAAAELQFEDVEFSEATGPGPYKRPISHQRTLYRRDDLTAPLKLGQMQSRALVFQEYALAFTRGLLSETYQRSKGGGSEQLIPTPASVLGGEGGYVLSDDAVSAGLFPNTDPVGNWWIPSGQVFHSPDSTDTPAQELAEARAHFFLTRRFVDPFGNATLVAYDGYDLLTTESSDALGNRVTVGTRHADGSVDPDGNDYRVLQPKLIADPNRNRAAAAYDALGLVTGTAMMGKPEDSDGDSLTGFEADLPEAVVESQLADPLADPLAVLGNATTRLVYDVLAYQRAGAADPQPSVVWSLSRTNHMSELAPGETPGVRHTLSYSDGLGREIQTKSQAEPGPLTEAGPAVSPRWVGSGWTIFNNKGKPAREYEPFFSGTHSFEFARTAGVSPVLFYDPIQRPVARLRPDDTYEKVVFDPWRETSWDANDTVLLDPRSDPDVLGPASPYLDTLPPEWKTWHARRRAGALGSAEQDAAIKAEDHAATPDTSYVDAMGRDFMSVAHNRRPNDGGLVEERYSTRVVLDPEGSQRALLDARGRVVMRYVYNAHQARIAEFGMDSGGRWALENVAGKAIRGWDSRGQMLSSSFDPLGRPTDVVLRDDGGNEKVVVRTLYGEGRADADANNLRSQLVEVQDPAGTRTVGRYDFRGRSTGSARRFAVDYKQLPDWGGTVALESEEYVSATKRDALDRPVRIVGADGSVTQPSYNEASLLERIEVDMHAGAESKVLVSDVDYDARGRRTRIAYGNGVTTRFSYDALTSRLTRVRTMRGPGFAADCPDPTGLPCGVQNMSYVYDPAGNVTRQQDDAQQTVFFRNRKVDPHAEYTYDAIYRLIEATGREHLGQVGGVTQPPTPTGAGDAPRVGIAHPADGNAMARYRERYSYDAVGNLLELVHVGTDPAAAGWTRAYDYSEPSLINPADLNNRLSATTVDGVTEQYGYDGPGGEHGDITSMASLPVMRWDYRDHLQASARQAVGAGAIPETTYYVYDIDGERIRKVTEGAAAGGEAPTRKSERRYLGSAEVYREFAPDGASTLERETLHVYDDKRRVAIIETRTYGADPAPPQLTRYQLDNHLGSAVLELDDAAGLISYEEYYPYGGTAHQAVRPADTPKRYRHADKERDEESGLQFYGARYYAPWLGRWMSSDPAGLADGPDLYAFCRNNPIRLRDPNGRQALPPEIQAAWDAAERAGYDDASVGRLIEAYEANRGATGQQLVTNSSALEYATVRASAAGSNWRQGNYGRAVVHGTAGIIESFGYALFGRTHSESAVNAAVTVAAGAAIGRLSLAGRTAQAELQASRQALIARIEARAAAPAPPAAAPPAAPAAAPSPSPAVPPAVVEEVTPPMGTRAPQAAVTPPSGTPIVERPTVRPPGGNTTPPPPPAPRLVNNSVPGERYFVQDTAHPRLVATGSVSRGELSISIRTVVDGNRSTLLRGSEQFRRILAFFQGQFTSIKGSWQYGSNLARFNELTAQGMAPAEAAAQTWSGRQAAAAGYTRVTVGILSGTPGHYTDAQVLFSRP